MTRNQVERLDAALIRPGQDTNQTGDFSACHLLKRLLNRSLNRRPNWRGVVKRNTRVARFVSDMAGRDVETSVDTIEVDNISHSLSQRTRTPGQKVQQNQDQGESASMTEAKTSKRAPRTTNEVRTGDRNAEPPAANVTGWQKAMEVVGMTNEEITKLTQLLRSNLVQRRIDSHGGAITCVDDFTAWVLGPTAQSNCEGIKAIISDTLKWEMRSEATFEAEKTAIIHFMRKMYKSNAEPFTIKG
ncbi:hypothetical protein OIDMADRAFT_33896 [Oidiodendron maius Zn]|uniref:Uncharacterized protein n=1 Tax=Oidiodendron maius (strain Zn) TaxID=913774 RepID=A0A0C3GI47_OIDMZ|nr:hypothetical protein OIDMADRAFT_33896 [Oidiodendron maius Zn]